MYILTLSMKQIQKQTNTKEMRFAILATDIVLFAIEEGTLKVLLIDVNVPPHFVNSFGLPGGLILPNETAEESVERHMKNKVGISLSYVEQLYTFSSINRDPRGRVVSVAYIGLVPESMVEVSKSKTSVYWKNVKSLPKLAYDHNEVVKAAVERLKSKLSYTTIVQGFLPEKFTLSELQNVYEVVLEKKFDKRNFRKKILSLGFLKKLDVQKGGVANRPADLFKFIGGSDQIFNIL